MAFNWKKLLIFPSDYASAGSRKNRATLRKLMVLGIAVLIFFPSIRFRFFSVLTYPLHYKEYKHFGIKMPSGFKIHGIDVSRYQSRVDWGRVGAMKVGDIRISFAFIKATEGSWIKDPQFYSNWDNARRSKLIRGAYHYFLPNINPKDQANHFIRTVKLRSGDLPPVLDVEETRGMSKVNIQHYTKIMLQLLEKHYKVKPILYTNRDFYKNYFANDPDFEGYRFWIAHYHVGALDMPDDNEWHFWQHSDKGTVNGINERVDFNVFNGDSADLRKLCLP